MQLCKAQEEISAAYLQGKASAYLQEKSAAYLQQVSRMVFKGFANVMLIDWETSYFYVVFVIIFRKNALTVKSAQLKLSIIAYYTTSCKNFILINDNSIKWKKLKLS